MRHGHEKESYTGKEKGLGKHESKQERAGMRILDPYSKRENGLHVIF